MQQLTLAIVLFLCFTQLNGQVRNIKDTADKDRSIPKTTASSFYASGESYPNNSSSSSKSNDYSVSDAFAEGIMEGIANLVFIGAYEGIKQSQRYTIYGAAEFPDRISLELSGSFSADIKKKTSLIYPALRGNYGIFASELRYSILDDRTGNLQNIDWQVFIIRVPIYGFKPEFGIGFTHLTAPKNSWLECSTGFEWSLLKQKGVLKSIYRWTSKTSNNKRYRQEVGTSFSYDLWEEEKFHLSPVIGYVYQEYYGEHFYNMAQIGLKMRIF